MEVNVIFFLLSFLLVICCIKLLSDYTSQRLDNDKTDVPPNFILYTINSLSTLCLPVLTVQTPDLIDSHRSVYQK